MTHTRQGSCEVHHVLLLMFQHGMDRAVLTECGAREISLKTEAVGLSCTCEPHHRIVKLLPSNPDVVREGNNSNT